MLTIAPPSTGSAVPVMKLASSEARNSAALATSQAVPILPRSGTLASRAAATSARGLPLWRARGATPPRGVLSARRGELGGGPRFAVLVANLGGDSVIVRLVGVL